MKILLILDWADVRGYEDGDRALHVRLMSGGWLVDGMGRMADHDGVEAALRRYAKRAPNNSYALHLWLEQEQHLSAWEIAQAIAKVIMRADPRRETKIVIHLQQLFDPG